MAELGTFERSGLDGDEIAAIVDDAFSLGPFSTVEEVFDGVNTTAILSAQDGEQYFVKFNTFNRNEPVFFSEPILLQYLYESSDVCVPKPIGYDYSLENTHFEWYITEAIHGEVFAQNTIPSDGNIEERVRLIGRILGQINSIQTPGFGYMDRQSDREQVVDINGRLPFSGESMNEEILTALRQILNIVTPRFRDLAEPVLDYVADSMVRECQPHLLHLDYWWENILWGDDGTVYVLDWERAFGGDPLANRRLSEHYLFDLLGIETACPAQNYDINTEPLLQVFRESYEEAYRGSLPLTADAETQAVYDILPYVRELRGFQYWWREKPTEWKEERAEYLRQHVESHLEANHML